MTEIALWTVLALGLAAVHVLHALGREPLGPLFPFEAVRLARNRWFIWQRAGFLGVLLVALHVGYAEFFGLDPREIGEVIRGGGLFSSAAGQARFARQMVVALLFAQAAALALLTPAAVAGTFAADAECRTLDLLLLTHWRAREIVAGKLAARLLAPLGLMLAGLPVLAMTRVWGGVDAVGLLAVYVVTAALVFALGGLGLYYSATRPSAAAAAVPAYVWAIAGVAAMVVGVPFLLGTTRSEAAAATACAVAWLTFIGVAGCGRASLCLREARTPVQPRVPSRPRRPYIRAVEAVGDWPLWWKERRQALDRLGGDRPVRYSFSFLVALNLIVGGLWVYVTAEDAKLGEQLVPFVHRWLQVVGLVCVGSALAVGLLVAVSVSGESERRTLDVLLAVPTERREVLRLKVLASLWAFRGAAVALAAGWAVGLLTGGLHPLAVPLLAVAAVVDFALFAALGAFVSVGCQTARDAMRGLAGAVVILVVCLGPAVEVACVLLGATPPPGLVEGVSPLRAWWALSFFDRDLAALDGLPGVLMGVSAHALLALALWQRAGWRFERLDRAD